MTLSNVNNTPLGVFDDEVLDFLGELSAALLASPLVRTYPDVAAFAFYIRKANLLRLKNDFGPVDGRLGRGLCFHVAPANIPINFAFSWVFSLLAGNANIVRMPSKDFPQAAALLEAVNRLLAQHPKIQQRNAFVRYPRTDVETTSAYSAQSDCRMLWGGDRTIASIKSMPTHPRCVDIAFADRYSVGLIDGSAIRAADDATLMRLAQDFYNDTYLMDQNACSSPQVVLWENDDAQARSRFWTAVEDVSAKKYVLQDAVAVDKYTALCEAAIGNQELQDVSRRGNLLYRLELKSLGADMTTRRGKAGFFYEYALLSRQDLFDVVTERFQTVTYFGIDAGELRNQIRKAHLRGIDRVVPFGKAMDIGAIWDGYDLIRTLSRIIAI